MAKKPKKKLKTAFRSQTAARAKRAASARESGGTGTASARESGGSPGGGKKRKK